MTPPVNIIGVIVRKTHFLRYGRRKNFVPLQCYYTSSYCTQKVEERAKIVQPPPHIFDLRIKARLKRKRQYAELLLLYLKKFYRTLFLLTVRESVRRERRTGIYGWFNDNDQCGPPDFPIIIRVRFPEIKNIYVNRTNALIRATKKSTTLLPFSNRFQKTTTSPHRRFFKLNLSIIIFAQK